MKILLWSIGVLLLLFQDSRAGITPIESGRSSGEFVLSLGVLVFGLIIIGLQSLIVLKGDKSWNTHSVRLMGLTLAIVGGLFLITAGYSQEQISPMIGLLGTIVGYLLGQTEQHVKH